MYNNIITNTIFFTRLLKKLVAIPVLLIFCFACYHPRTGVDTEVSDTISVYEPDAVPFDQVDIKPQFNDRYVNDFSEWFINRFKIPDSVAESDIIGRVVIQFTIGTDGSVRDIKVLKSLDKDIDAEVVRVVGASPKWSPGKNADDVAVPVLYDYSFVYMIR